jgi:hypothetical protein
VHRQRCVKPTQGGSQTYICASTLFPSSYPLSELAFKHVVLVGGFAASDWLFREVREKLLPHDMDITRPDCHLSVAAFLEIHLALNSLFRNKAVSDGALSFYHDHFVRSKGLKITGGEFMSVGGDFYGHSPRQLSQQREGKIGKDC